MSYFLISLVVIGVAVVAMALGVLIQNKPLKGSCGGLNKVMGEDCDFCDEEQKSKCRLKHQQEKS